MASEAELKALGEKYVPKDYDPALYRLRHSFAHVLARWPVGFASSCQAGASSRWFASALPKLILRVLLNS